MKKLILNIAVLICTIGVAQAATVTSTKKLSEFGSTNDMADTDLITLSVNAGAGNETIKGITFSNLASKISGNVAIGNSVFVSTNGNNTTGTRGRLDKQFRTLAYAKTNALAGDTIFVFPGNYTNNNLLKAGVNWYFYPGANVYYTMQGQTDAGYGIFDDRGSGATTNTIGGAGEFYYTTGTTGYNSGTPSYTTNPTNNAFIKGLFVTTNANTSVNFSAKRLSIESIINLGLTSSCAALHVQNCRRNEFHIDEIDDPNKATDAITYGTDEDSTPQTTESSAAGIFWILGNIEAHINTIDVRGYCYWGAEPSTNVTSYNMWLYTQQLRTRGTLASTVYVSARTTGYRTWIYANEITADKTGFAAISSYNGGRTYINAQKVFSGVVTNVGAGVAVSCVGNGQLWLTAQKLTAQRRWIETFYGFNRFDCLEYEDGGGMTDGFKLAGGTNYIRGGIATITNAPGVIWYEYATNKNVLDSLTIKVVGATLTNAPIFAFNTNHAINRLTLKNCLLLTDGTNSVYATNSSVTIQAIGTGMNTNAYNASFQGHVITNGAFATSF
jgi:hypothetical protein